MAFLEAGSGWIPFFLQRLDEEHEKRGHVEAKLLTKPLADRADLTDAQKVSVFSGAGRKFYGLK